MKVTRTSMITKETHTLDLPVTPQQLAAYEQGALLQEAFPHLDPPQREFIKSGITPEEWQTHVLSNSDAEADAEGEQAAKEFLEQWEALLARIGLSKRRRP